MNIILIISIICFALCFLMFFYLKWYIKKRTSASNLLADDLDERKREAAKLAAEIDRITDRDSRLVEERILKLKAMLDEADKRIALYVKELEKSKSGETLYSSLGRGIRDALNIPQETSQTPDAQQTFPADTISLSRQTNLDQSGYKASQFVPVKPPVPVPETPEKPVPQNGNLPPSPPPNKQQIRSRIDLLLNEGLSAEDIAARLGISIAEVNLAINLRRTGNAAY